tara:strand:- start:101 stop:301 length:201 start_codon:yes stop_codon:yes gene_type:complete
MFDEVKKLLASKEQAKLDEICNFCGEAILSFRDRESEEEYQISALCQSCQDGVFESDPFSEETDEI